MSTVKRIKTAENNKATGFKISSLIYCLNNSKIHGVSRWVKNPVSIKLMWIFFTISAIVGTIMIMAGNISYFFVYDVITKTKVQNRARQTVHFPAVTLCTSRDTEHKMEKYLFRCFFKDYAASDSDSNCFPGDFERIKVYGDQNKIVKNCFRYNAGTNSTGQKVPFQTINKVGFLHGLHTYLYVPPDDVFTYFVGKLFGKRFLKG